MPVDETQQLKPTRTSFIRALPLAMPIDEVIERGREIGISIQPSDVHSARYYVRQEADARLSSASTDVARIIRPLVFQSADAHPVPEPDELPQTSTRSQRQVRIRKRPRPKPPERNQSQSLASVEQELRAVVLRLGTDRVRAMIEEIENSTLQRALDVRRTPRAR